MLDLFLLTCLEVALKPQHSDQMGGIFRSVDMTYVTISISQDDYRATMKAIGALGKLHILGDDEHTWSKAQTEQKAHMMECLYWLRKVKEVEDLMQTYNISADRIGNHVVRAPDPLHYVKERISPVQEEIGRHLYFLAENARALARDLEEIAVLNQLRDNIVAAGGDFGLELNSPRPAKRDSTKRSASEMVSLLHADNEAESLEESICATESPIKKPREDRPAPPIRKVIAGTIPRGRQGLIKRMLYRATRGNYVAKFVLMKSEPQDFLTINTNVPKSVFYAMVLGDRNESMVKSICLSLGAQFFTLPRSVQDCDEKLARAREDLQHQKEIRKQTEAAVLQTLQRLAWDGRTSPLRVWKQLLQDEVAISEALMCCRFYNTTISFECWLPTESLGDLRSALNHAVQGTGVPPAFVDDQSPPPAQFARPPTCFNTNKYTDPFQIIVNTYGVPRYKEVNPGLFTIVTFPFLFAVMYGDVGHGSCLFLFGCLLLLKESSLLNSQRKGQLGEIGELVFGGRYLIFLMGFFSLYCGFIYNDCFSVGLRLFPSGWERRGMNIKLHSTGYIYPFGIDYAWYGSSNKLAFLNSYKMKLAVILGVVHMTFGLLLSLSNHLYFKDRYSIWFQFVPQILFLWCTFGYMVILILYKFSVDWSTVNQTPPSLLTTMIGMFISPGNVPVDTQLYTGQATLQVFLLVVAVLSVPVMLLVKPLLKHAEQSKQPLPRDSQRASLLDCHLPSSQQQSISPSQSARWEAVEDELDLETAEDRQESIIRRRDATPSSKGLQTESRSGQPQRNDDDPRKVLKAFKEHHDFGEDLLHQAIHTIEFVLGTVSNTASYLRLWALSLAHAQLAEVFWENLIILDKGPIALVIGATMWIFATVGVLLMMDVLECFLHALRLHWVEFQNKFYYADGYAFKPFVLTKDLSIT
eukprot:g44414.t1